MVGDFIFVVFLVFLFTASSTGKRSKNRGERVYDTRIVIGENDTYEFEHIAGAIELLPMVLEQREGGSAVNYKLEVSSGTSSNLFCYLYIPFDLSSPRLCALTKMMTTRNSTLSLPILPRWSFKCGLWRDNGKESSIASAMEIATKIRVNKKVSHCLESVSSLTTTIIEVLDTHPQWMLMKCIAV